jgi:hypothetical protein
MTVGELRALLDQCADDSPVFVDIVDTPRGTLHGATAEVVEGDLVIRPAPR